MMVRLSLVDMIVAPRMFRFCTVLICAGWLGGCASTGAVPRPFPAAGDRAPATAPTAGRRDNAAEGYAIAATALELRGAPYRNGGADPSGFDCSGFIWYVFAEHGLALPRTVEEQFREGIRVDPDALAAGDLVFFRTDGRSVSHVGLSIGGQQFVHAPSSRGSVRVEHLESSYWRRRFAGARRLR
jgi:cell wall-associated NlpC family hydrolase